MAVEAGQTGTGSVRTELRENAVGLPGILMQGIATTASREFVTALRGQSKVVVSENRLTEQP